MQKYYTEIGITSEYIGRFENSELLKLISTTYYGWNILFAKLVRRIISNYGNELNMDMAFDDIYTKPNQSYNDGYQKMGLPQYVRPTLVPPDGIIGGHCVTQNFELLIDSELKRYCKEINENYNEGV